MESAFHWTCSPTAVNVKRVTVVPCATRRASSLTPAEGYSVNMEDVRFQTRVMPSATVRVATPESCVMQVRLIILNHVPWGVHV